MLDTTSLAELAIPWICTAGDYCKKVVGSALSLLMAASVASIEIDDLFRLFSTTDQARN